MTIVLTLIASLPAVFCLIKKPENDKFKLSLFVISMSFFFFSYHVHEKTILFPLAMLCINMK